MRAQQHKPLRRVKYLKPFEPLPWQEEPWRDTSSVMLLTGSAGGGKSYLAANKVHGYLLKYPESTGLILRKSRAIMSNSTLVFLRREVIGRDPRVKLRAADFRFEYDNGSILVYGGMKDADQRERIRSVGLKGGVDIAWLEEATQFDEEDFNEVLARMRGTAAPWRQIILTTNPDAPGHWINVRLILGREASVYYSNAADNRHNSRDYATTLGKLSGVQYQRLVLGQWAAGAGKIIDTWTDDYNAVRKRDHGGNVSGDAIYDTHGGPVFWAVDDGYAGAMDANSKMFTGKSHPRAILLCQQDSQGRIKVFGESFAIKLLALDHIEKVKALSAARGWALPSYIIRDRAAASLDGAFHAAGLPKPRYNTMTVEESVKVLREWCAPDENGFRKIVVHPDCFYTRYQMQTYSYDSEGRVIKEHDDGPDALRYLAWDREFGKAPVVDILTWADVEMGVVDGVYA